MVHCKSIDYLLLLENSRNFAKKQQILDESDAIQMTSVMMIINIITWSQRCRTIAVLVLKSSRDNKIHITINSPSSYYHITSLKQNRFLKENHTQISVEKNMKISQSQSQNFIRLKTKVSKRYHVPRPDLTLALQSRWSYRPSGKIHSARQAGTQMNINCSTQWQKQMVWTIWPEPFCNCAVNGS